MTRNLYNYRLVETLTYLDDPSCPFEAEVGLWTTRKTPRDRMRAAEKRHAGTHRTGGRPYTITYRIDRLPRS